MHFPVSATVLAPYSFLAFFLYLDDIYSLMNTNTSPDPHTDGRLFDIICERFLPTCTQELRKKVLNATTGFTFNSQFTSTTNKL